MIWDLPTRIFHWLLVACVVGSISSAKSGNMNWHEGFGVTLLGLLGFRIIWGFVGHTPSRFAAFVKPPVDILAYLKNIRRRETNRIGHNPLGALSVIALLTILLLQVLSGSFSTDDILYDGPLYHLAGQIAENFAALAGSWHHLGQRLIFALVGLHLAAILAHRIFFKQRLTRDMISGGRTNDLPRPSGWRTMGGLILMAACIAAAWLLVVLKP